MDIFQVQTVIKFFKSLLSDSSLSSIILLLSGLLYLAHAAFVEEGIWFRIYIPLAYTCHSVLISRSETITAIKNAPTFPSISWLANNKKSLQRGAWLVVFCDFSDNKSFTFLWNSHLPASCCCCCPDWYMTAMALFHLTFPLSPSLS